MSFWELLLISANAAWTEHETFQRLVGLNSIEESFKTVNLRHCAPLAVHPLSIYLQIKYSRWISNLIQGKRTSTISLVITNIFITSNTIYSTTHTSIAFEN